MHQLIVDNLAPIMFVSLILFICLGYPISFSLAALGLGFGLIGIELGLFAPTFLQALPDRVLSIMSNEVLLAIPFFTFMGLILERSGMAEDLLDTIGQLFGSVRGGMAYAVIFVGALMAATTGVLAAAVISMGLISLPVMLRYKYNRPLATSVIAASGTLAQIIPPSIVLIVLADQLGVSVGDMYAGAIVPGLMLVSLYAIYVMVLSIIYPESVPALPQEARNLGPGLMSLWVTIGAAIVVGVAATAWFEERVEQAPAVYGSCAGVLLALAIVWVNRALGLGLLSKVAETVITVLVPPLALIFLVLGTIFVGIATPTEGGAMGAVGALVLAIVNRRLDFGLARSACEGTLRLSAFVIFILIGARVFSLTFYGLNGHVWIKDMLLALPGGEIGFIIFVMIVIFILGCFIDFFEIAFIVIPLLIAPMRELGIDPVWFGVMMSINLQTSFLTPPFGFALFFLRSVTPAKTYVDKITSGRIEGIKTSEIYRGVVPFICLQLVMIAIVYTFPMTVMHYRSGQLELDSGMVIESLENFGGVPDDDDAFAIPEFSFD